MSASFVLELLQAVTNFLREKGHKIRGINFNADTHYFSVDTINQEKICTFTFYEKEDK